MFLNGEFQVLALILIPILPFQRDFWKKKTFSELKILFLNSEFHALVLIIIPILPLQRAVLFENRTKTFSKLKIFLNGEFQVHALIQIPILPFQRDFWKKTFSELKIFLNGKFQLLILILIYHYKEQSFLKKNSKLKIFFNG
jgi:hypothetical protein